MPDFIWTNTGIHLNKGDVLEFDVKTFRDAEGVMTTFHVLNINLAGSNLPLVQVYLQADHNVNIDSLRRVVGALADLQQPTLF